MKRPTKGTFTSRRAKRIYLLLLAFSILFFVCNDIILPWYVNQGGIVEVPSVLGVPYDDAVKSLATLGLEGRKGDVRLDKDHPAGLVIIQSPFPGEKVKRGRRVYMTISGGEQLVAIPSVKGRTLRDAKFALERQGLKLGTVEYRPSDSFPQNTVIEQAPGAGATAKRDAFVSIVVSQGNTFQKITVPDVTRKSLTEAKALLAASGLKLGNITYIPSTELLPNTVVEQFPLKGELVSSGQAVDLFVVQGGERNKDIIEY
ncbi:MAG TPA: PASTA domain-containing protein [Bacteroidota bacterium]|jgi:serine/threonine-protein kinase